MDVKGTNKLQTKESFNLKQATFHGKSKKKKNIDLAAENQYLLYITFKIFRHFGFQKTKNFGKIAEYFFSLQDGRKLGYGGMQGIPMVASSPVRHESPLGLNPIEVHSYQPPWKALSDFALHTDLDRLDPAAPPFQHLVNQVIMQ